MGEKKITIMVIKVDLGCEKCRKKIKKVLCSIPQIQNQVYDEKTNTVIITVICCCPEKVMKKICCKGGKTVKSIEIKVPEKPKPTEKPKLPEKPPKEPEKPKPIEKPPKELEKQKPPLKLPPADPCPPIRVPCVPVCPPPVVQPRRTCCRECYEGHNWGPCYQGYPRPAPCYDYYPRPVYENWRGGYGGCYVSKCDYYLCEENPQGCTIM